MTLIKLTKKQKDKLNLIMNNLHQDVNYRYGGWTWLFGKLMWNAVLLWVFFGFIQVWYFFVFKDAGMDADQIQSLRTILWAIGLIWVVIIGFSTSRIKKV